MNILEFQTNTPQVLALASSQRYPLRNKGFFFEAQGDTWFFLDTAAAESFAALKLEPGETFGICRRTSGAAKPYWDIWLTPETEQRRASKEIEEETGEDLTPLLVASIREVERKKRREAKQTVLPMPPPAAQEALQPTGTDGPAPIPLAACGKRNLPPRLPYNVAFQEVLAFVTAGLRQAGEQWNDQAKQDLVSTVIITASKQGWLTLWEREVA
jgi:hypothetical protein